MVRLFFLTVAAALTWARFRDDCFPYPIGNSIPVIDSVLACPCQAARKVDSFPPHAKMDKVAWAGD